MADRAKHFFSIEDISKLLWKQGGRNPLSVTNLFIKVEIEHDERENPQKLGAEICRQVMKIYGVRWAEVSNFTAVEE